MQTEMYAFLKTELKQDTFGLFVCLSVISFASENIDATLLNQLLLCIIIFVFAFYTAVIKVS